MIALSPEAEAQLDALIAHYEALGRIEASINLLSALERAQARIAEKPEAGLFAPRPYPALARTGRRWIIEGSYSLIPREAGGLTSGGLSIRLLCDDQEAFSQRGRASGADQHRAGRA